MQDTEEKKISYKVFWSGEEVSTKFLAEFYKNELDELKAKNSLLGSFSSEGKYAFDAETKKALIAIKKRVEEKTDNALFVLAKTSKNVFTFRMRLFEVDKDFMAANLYLIEVVDDQRIEKPLKTFVAQYVDKKDEEFLAKAKYIFNISIDGEFLEKDRVENEEILAQLPKAKGLKDEDYESVAKDFVEEILSELENCGETGKKILEKFKKVSEAKEGGEQKASTLKQLLEKTIEENGGLEKLAKENPKIGEIVEKANKKTKELKEPEIFIKPQVESQTQKKEEKKEEKKDAGKSGGKSASKGGGGKSGGGKSGGGGGKKGGKSGGGGGGKKKDKKKKDNKKDTNPFSPQEFKIKVNIPTLDLKKEGGKIVKPTLKKEGKEPPKVVVPARKAPVVREEEVFQLPDFTFEIGAEENLESTIEKEVSNKTPTPFVISAGSMEFKIENEEEEKEVLIEEEKVVKEETSELTDPLSTPIPEDKTQEKNDYEMILETLNEAKQVASAQRNDTRNK